MRALLVVLAISVAPALALADAMPACEEGQHLETNPVAPGAMHHAGGRCVDDPGRGGCSIAHGAASAGSAAALIAAAGLLVARRRAR